jgi:predicted Rdx family selenoprotein
MQETWRVADGGMAKDENVKQQVRELLDRLPDDCSFADVQRGIAVLMWPKPDGPVPPDEVKRRLRQWLKPEKDK